MIQHVELHDGSRRLTLTLPWFSVWRDFRPPELASIAALRDEELVADILINELECSAMAVLSTYLQDALRVVRMNER